MECSNPIRDIALSIYLYPQIFALGYVIPAIKAY